MLEVLFLMISLFLILFLIAVLFFVILRASSLSFTGAPYIQIPKEVLGSIVEALEIKKDGRVYDLGCGDGRVLIAGYKQMSEAEYIGVDNSLLPVLAARRKIAKMGVGSAIRIIKEDLFKTDLSSATHIFIYLYPKLADALLAKFERELKPGTRVVACDYKIGDRVPNRVIDLKRGQEYLGRYLYIYDF